MIARVDNFQLGLNASNFVETESASVMEVVEQLILFLDGRR
jgi:hypothetical protein